MKTARLGPSRWQLHFSTLLGLMFFAGALIGCNLHITSSNSDHVIGLGWPFLFSSAYSPEGFDRTDMNTSISRDSFLDEGINFYILGFDVLFGIALLGGLAWACEYINRPGRSTMREYAARRFKR